MGQKYEKFGLCDTCNVSQFHLPGDKVRDLSLEIKLFSDPNDINDAYFLPKIYLYIVLSKSPPYPRD